MTGNYEHKIDAKGRVFIPSDLRKQLGDVFHVMIFNEECINVYPDNSWARLVDKVSALPIRKQSMMRPLFANTSRCELDGQGRFVLPLKLREKIGLQKDVTIVGAGTLVQIWDTEKFNEINEQESTPESIAAVLDELDF